MGLSILFRDLFPIVKLSANPETSFFPPDVAAFLPRKGTTSESPESRLGGLLRRRFFFIPPDGELCPSDLSPLDANENRLPFPRRAMGFFPRRVLFFLDSFSPLPSFLIFSDDVHFPPLQTSLSGQAIGSLSCFASPSTDLLTSRRRFFIVKYPHAEVIMAFFAKKNPFSGSFRLELCG